MASLPPAALGEAAVAVETDHDVVKHRDAAEIADLA
jgi:hypothetical protein